MSDEMNDRFRGVDDVLRQRAGVCPAIEPWPAADAEGWHTFWWEDLQLLARLRLPDDTGYMVEYEVYAPVGWGNDGQYLLYEGRRNQPHTEDLAKASTFCFGTIKWDTCSHNYFGEQAGEGTKEGADGYLHGCSLANMSRIGPMFERLWAAAHKLLGEHAIEGFFQ